MLGLLRLSLLLTVSLQICAAQAFDNAAKDTKPVVVKPVMTTGITSSGQPITLPSKNVRVVVSTYEIAPGTTLPVHKHPFPRYAYVLAGVLEVTSVETGKSNTFKAGDFIVEVIDQWHKGSNIGADPVKLLVIDQIEDGAQQTILRE